MPRTALSLRTKLFKLPLAMSLALAAAGCGDSPLGNTGDRLALEEVSRLVEAMYNVAFIGIDLPSEPGAFSGTVDRTLDCGTLPEAGFVTVQGAYQVTVLEAGDFEITGDVILDFIGCEMRDGDDALDLNGDPGVRIQYDIERLEGVSTRLLDFGGAISFTGSDGRTGRCAVDLRLQVIADPPPLERVASGSACGTAGSEFDIP